MENPIIVWFRRDLRLSDHPALQAAVKTGRPIIPLYIFDENLAVLGAAAKWRVKKGLRALARDLEALGNQLVLRTGPAEFVLGQEFRETNATEVYYTRSYHPPTMKRDLEVQKSLAGIGCKLVGFPGALLFEPSSVSTQQGKPFQVYTHFWNAVKNRQLAPCLPRPQTLRAPIDPADTEELSSWQLGQDLHRGRLVLRKHVRAGEAAAQAKLQEFIETRIATYHNDRDFLAIPATSELSDHLSFGEISPRQCWHAGMRALEQGAAGAEVFLKQLVWREFAWHLFYHAADLNDHPMRKEWDLFPWKTAENTPEVQAWQRGQTGIDLVDAAMRELYVTGRMHNRARMIVASYLTKHLQVDWRVGQKWFSEHLIDWDPAANTLGWQWVAGCGPDAAPYFRVFNPDVQAEKFDPVGTYRRRWLDVTSSKDAASYFKAVPKSWKLYPNAPRPKPIVDLAVGRKNALDAYEAFRLSLA